MDNKWILRSFEVISKIPNFLQLYQSFFVHFLGHLIHTGDLLLWVYVRRRPLCVKHLINNYIANLNQIWYDASLGYGDKKL